MSDRDDDTPVERPVRHDGNLRYVRTLRDVIPILWACNNTLTELLRTIRLEARPVGQQTLNPVAAVGDGLIRAGRLLKSGFRPPG
jgi:hypothetical protein